MYCIVTLKCMVSYREWSVLLHPCDALFASQSSILAQTYPSLLPPVPCAAVVLRGQEDISQHPVHPPPAALVGNGGARAESHFPQPAQ